MDGATRDYRWNMPLKVAVTGGIGSGKSYVCGRLTAHGIRIYDCDSAAKRIISASPDIRAALTGLVGPDAYVGGQLNKAAVAAFLLASEDNAKAIDAIVHPAVARDFIESGIGWMECAILYESGFDRLVDRVVAVTAPRETRIGRIMRRDGISRDKAIEWMDRQMEQEEVARRADFVIENDGVRDLDRQIYELINKLK